MCWQYPSSTPAKSIADCIYTRRWLPSQAPPPSPGNNKATARPLSSSTITPSTKTGSKNFSHSRADLSVENDAKLMFGTVFSLRNIVRKIGGEDDTWIGLPFSYKFFFGFLSLITHSLVGWHSWPAAYKLIVWPCYVFYKLLILSNIAIQTTSLWDSHQRQICHAHRHQSWIYEDCVAPNLC